MFVLLILVLFLISFLWALWAWRETNNVGDKVGRKAREKLLRGRVIFYDASSTTSSSSLSDSSSSRSSRVVTSGFSSSAKASSRTKG